MVVVVSTVVITVDVSLGNSVEFIGTSVRDIVVSDDKDDDDDFVEGASVDTSEVNWVTAVLSVTVVVDDIEIVVESVSIVFSLFSGLVSPLDDNVSVVVWISFVSVWYGSIVVWSVNDDVGVDADSDVDDGVNIDDDVDADVVGVDIDDDVDVGTDDDSNVEDKELISVAEGVLPWVVNSVDDSYVLDWSIVV